ncbi:hypothetical protein BDZ97DRAFT_1768394 [Flammula alnicola]|nr:hypothetical protein BDZ97DRAFT_1768394 [Flammula alnicola]
MAVRYGRGDKPGGKSRVDSYVEVDHPLHLSTMNRPSFPISLDGNKEPQRSQPGRPSPCGSAALSSCVKRPSRQPLLDARRQSSTATHETLVALISAYKVVDIFARLEKGNTVPELL